MTIKLNKEVQERLTGSIRRYAAKNLDEEMGELKARLLLDFCLQEIGPSIYNQAIADAQAYMLEKSAEIDAHCYQAEFGYWKSSGRGRT